MVLGEILANWGSYSLKTQVVTVAAGILLLLSFGLGLWSHYLRVSDQNRPTNTAGGNVTVDVSSSIKIDVHNYYRPGQFVTEDEQLFDGWEQSVQNGRTYLWRMDNEIVDLGEVKIKTVSILNDENVVEWRYRIFSMIEGAAWDVDSWRVFRNADGIEINLETLLNNERIRQQIDFSDIVFAFGLASNLKGETADQNLLLSHQRAEWLAKAIAKFSIVSGSHRWSAEMGGEPGEGTIYGEVYMVPLGEANLETELGDPDEPFQRAAIVVGVDILQKDPDLEELLSFVVAPEISATTDLSAYMLSNNPTLKLRRIQDPRSYGELRAWPEEYSVQNDYE